MLQQLLDEMRRGGSLDIKELAVRLDTTPQMVQTLIDFLQRSGYLRRYTACQAECKDCSLAAFCGGPDKTEPRLWVLSDEDSTAAPGKK